MIWIWLLSAMTVVGQTVASATGATQSERAVAFAIQQEVKARKLADGEEICVAMGAGLEVNYKSVLALLRNEGTNVKTSDVCTRQGHGLTIAAVSPTSETSPGIFKITVQVADSVIQKGEHFATLLRKGSYIVRCEVASKPQLISYQQTCCSENR